MTIRNIHNNIKVSTYVRHVSYFMRGDLVLEVFFSAYYYAIIFVKLNYGV